MAAYQCLNCEQIETSGVTCCEKPDLFCINKMPSEILELRKKVAALEAQLAAVQQGVPEGFVLMPKRVTADMQQVMDEEGWFWEDLLATACKITEKEYSELSAHPTQHWLDAIAALEALVRDADSEPDGDYLDGAGKNRVAVHRKGIERARAIATQAKQGSYKCPTPKGFVMPNEPEWVDGHDYEGFSGGCARMGCQPHDLYKTSDADKPKVICDRNGGVVLGLCKKCGRGEAELSEPCIPRQKGDER